MRKSTKIIICVLISAVVCIIAGVTVFVHFFSGLSRADMPPYCILPLPSEIKDRVLDDELNRLSSFGDTEPVVAGERNKYDLKIAVNSFTDDYSYAMAAIHETVSFKNRTGETLNEISFRDYAQAWITEARTNIVCDSSNAFDADTEIFNIKNLVTGAKLDAIRDKSDNSIIYISLDKPLYDGDAAVISFDFTVPITQSGLRATIAEVGNDKYSMELGNFYPILSERKNGEWVNHPDFISGECFLSVCSDYTVTASVPRGWTVISTGDEIKGKTANGYTIWKCNAENVRDFAMTVSNGYEYVESVTKTGVKTRFWYYEDGEVSPNYDNSSSDNKGVDYKYHIPDNYNLSVSGALKASVRALELFDEKIGKYGYDSMDVLVSTLGRGGYFPGGGMEYPQYVTFSESYINAYELIAHEIGHNWFYGVAGNDEYLDTWLDEGLTTFLENLYQEEVGNESGQPFSGKENIKKEAKKYKTKIDISADLFESDNEYVCVVYSRAAYFIFELRDALGEERLLDLLKEYYETYSFREATTEQFVEIAAKYISDNPKAQKLFDEYLSRHQ